MTEMQAGLERLNVSVARIATYLYSRTHKALAFALTLPIPTCENAGALGSRAQSRWLRFFKNIVADILVVLLQEKIRTGTQTHTLAQACCALSTRNCSLPAPVAHWLCSCVAGKEDAWQLEDEYPGPLRG
jgi:hypothetical protein